MKGLIYRLAGVLGWWCLLCAPAGAAVIHQAGLDWYSVESEHFQIHYHDGLEPRARQVLTVAERVHGRLSAFLQWQPQGRTEIVLTDEYDVSNGYASPLPDNRMTLYLAAPDDISSLEDYGDWLTLVFTHEYLHILHLDKASGAPGFMRNIFGRFLLLFPNAFQPAWFTEGLATYVETDTERGVGRGQSSYYDMQMRMESLGGLKPLRQVNQPMASWPMGTTPYLYGVFFYQFLAERYGEQKIRQLVGNYSNNIIPFRINSNTRQVLGKDLDQLWAEFDAYLLERYQAQSERIHAEGESVAERLSNDGYYAGPLVMGPSGAIYYIAYDAMRRPGLIRRVSGEAPERLRDVAFGSRLALHPDKGLLLSQPEVCRNAGYYYDLYRYDFDGGDKQRLTHCGRYRMAAWSPGGESIIAVHNEAGRNALHRLFSTGELQEVLWEGKHGEVISHIDMAPDGSRLAASLWRPGQGWDLATFDLADRAWTALTQSQAIENHPRFSADGQSLLFSADYGGIYNIQRMALATGRTERLTNVIGGAFYPALSADGEQLIYAGYSEAGFDLYRHALSANRVYPVEPQAGSGALSPPVSPVVALSETHDYSPFSSLRPRWWFPNLYIDEDRTEIGIITSGSDTLQRHNYALGLGYDAENEWGFGSFDYIYDRFTPILKLHADNTYEHGYDNLDEIQKIRVSRNYQAEVVIPWLTVDNWWALHLGAAEESESDAWLNDPAVAEPELTDRIAGMAVSYASAKEFARGISRVDGREVMLVAEDSDAIEGSDFTGRAYTLDWKEFIRLGGEHVLAVRLLGAQGDEGIRPFNLGGVEEVNYMPQIFDSPAANSPFSRRQYALRGYDDGLPQLTGTQMRLGSVEYRFPLVRLERGYMAPPIGLHQLHGALFAEAGSAWFDGGEEDDYYGSYGAEFKADTVLFYGYLLRLSLGYAHGTEEIGEDQYYLRLGGAF